MAERVARRGLAAAIAPWHAPDPLAELLRERTRWPLAVPVVAVFWVGVFVMRVFERAALDSDDSLIVWGANIATRTGNGDWWRILVATLVHAGFFTLVVNLAALLTAGRLLERLLGPLMFIAAYVMCGMTGNLAALWISPLTVSSGPSAALFGIYGLLLAAWMWGAFQRATSTVRLATVGRLAIPAVAFVAFHMADGDLPLRAEIAGCVTGFVAGLFLTRRAAVRKPSLRGIGAATAATLFFTFTLWEPVRGLTDARPELARVIEMEQSTSSAYDTAAGRFRRGTATAKELADLIERSMIPAVGQRLQAVGVLGKVPAEHEALVAAARDYLRLRDVSWRTRASALRRGSMPLLREAEATEHTALRRYAQLVTLLGSSAATR
jgi:membrane associated rhomboid family serine protease